MVRAGATRRLDDACRTVAVLSVHHTVAETGSTNTDLLAMARDGAAEGTWLRAERQTAGRGRQGREWRSPPGNLYASTLVRLRPADPPAASLALVAGIALYHGIETLGAPAVRLKWPNDMMLGDAKVAGVLLEREGDAVVIGFGVNVASHPELAERKTAALAPFLWPQVTLADVWHLLDREIGIWRDRWRAEGLGPIVHRWEQCAHAIGTPLTVRPGRGEAIEGLYDGLDADGALMLRLATGERRAIHAGDVFLV